MSTWSNDVSRPRRLPRSRVTSGARPDSRPPAGSPAPEPRLPGQPRPQRAALARAAGLALGLLAAVPATISAQGWIEPPDRPLPAPFGVVKLRTAVSVEVDQRTARVEVEEWFQNRGAGLAEGDYLYPLPGEAVFADFSLFQGDHELRGETMDADRARAIYEDIVRRRRDPALIELAGHGLIRARVFPIGPGETRRIVLHYTQVLSRAGDALQFRYAAGGRRVSGPQQAVHLTARPDRVPAVRPAPDPAPLDFVLRARDGTLFRDPFSPTHTLRTTRDAGRLTVRPAGELRGDFSLFLPLARGLVGMTVAAHRPAGEDGYFMLTLSPGDVAGASLPRDVTVVLDVSGSMSGAKMEQARQAVHQLLGTLGRADRFRLAAFSSRVTTYRPDWTPASTTELEAARRWVDGLRPHGGTDIASALDEAFRLTTPERRMPVVVFLTDGLPSVGETDPERIADRADRNRGRARVFAFGIGYDVNTYLLDRLGAAGRGTTEYVEPDEDVESALATLAHKIRHPVLADLAIGTAPVRLLEIYPAVLPDLFAGEELILFGRYASAGETRRGTLTVTGVRNGRTERFSVEAGFPEHELGNDFIPRLWAARKIGALMQAIRLEGRDPELEREVRETALRYGLLSEYTAHLVQEPLDAIAGRDGVLAPSTTLDSAAPPAAAAGRAAVVAAERARVRREVRSSAELERAEARLAHVPPSPATPTTFEAASVRRIVAGRLFLLRDGIWTDAAHADSLRVVTIEPFGRAFFDLLRLAPELRPYFSAFDSLLVAGKSASIRVARGGAERLADDQLQRLVLDFRGHVRSGHP